MKTIESDKQAAEVHTMDGVQLDVNDRPISPRRRRWGMNVNIVCAGLGTLFAVIYWPGSSLFNIYMRERLGATLTQIGFFSAIVGIGQLAQLAGVTIFERTRTRKRLWVALVLAYRLMTFSTIGFALYAHYYGATPSLIWSLLTVLAIGFAMAQLTANAWWSWIADLVPETVRGRFLANRQVAATIAMIVGTLPVILLDSYGKDDAGRYTQFADWIFIGIFGLCSLSGAIDIIIHGFIPEPARQDRPAKPPTGRSSLANLLAPLRDKRFWKFTLSMTLGSFTVMMSAPFVWPYLVDADAINMAYSMFFISMMLHCAGMLLGSRYWGILADRFGAKPVLAITYTCGLLPVYLLFITKGNANLLVMIVSVLGGILWSGFMTASAQLMLTLAPVKQRSSYVAVHASVTGLALLIAPFAAGWLGDMLKSYFDALPQQHILPWGTVVTHMQVLVALSLVFRLAIYPLLMQVREGKEKPVGMVLNTVLGISQFRTLYGMRIFRGRDKNRRLAALRRMGASSDQLAVEQVIEQLADAEPEIRQEAVLALGRIGGQEAVDALVTQLASPESDVQLEAARALGMTGDPRAMAPLMEKLTDPNEIVRERAAEALGELKLPQVASGLMNLLKQDQPPGVFGRSAMALAKLGVLDAIWEILPTMHQTSNVALRRQLATAIGNLLGVPTVFYHLLNDELRCPGDRAHTLVQEMRKKLARLAREIKRSGQTVRAEHLLNAGNQLQQAAEQFEFSRYADTADTLHKVGLLLVRGIFGYHGQDDVAVEFALSRHGQLGIGLWFLQVSREYAAKEASKDELLRLDALLGFHFLHSYIHWMMHNGDSVEQEDGRSAII